MGKVHELKLHKHFFSDVASGKKTFELRKNDRKFEVGDIIILEEWDGRDYCDNRIKAEIVYMLDDYACNGLKDDYVILGIKLLTI